MRNLWQLDFPKAKWFELRIGDIILIDGWNNTHRWGLTLGIVTGLEELDLGDGAMNEIVVWDMMDNTKYIYEKGAVISMVSKYEDV